MIKRYTRPEMGTIWTEIHIKTKWLAVEAAVLWAREQLKEITLSIYQIIETFKVTEDIIKRAEELEKLSDHDLIAFLSAVKEIIEQSDLDPELKRLIMIYLHDGLTSYDTEDTGISLVLVEAIDILIERTRNLRSIIFDRAKEHKHTVEIGRTHFIHAEPITFGLKLLTWVDVLDRHLERLKALREEVRVGKISGAVGTYVLDPRIEAMACQHLGLKPAKISTQILSRDIIVRYTATMVGITNSLERFATEIRHLSGTDISETKEFKSEKAKGSSAMPGKSFLANPIKSENVSGLVKVMRGYLITSYECEAVWNERTLENSAPERIHLPDSTILADFILTRFADTMVKLEVFPEQMMRNLNKTGGIIFAQRVMMALTEKGIIRDEAYAILESLAKSVERGTFVTEDGATFKDLVKTHPSINLSLSQSEIEKCFSPETSLKYIDEIFSRFEK